MMIELESERLSIREMTADDLACVFPVLASNPDFLRLTEGSDGEIGRYNLERFQRDWQIGQFMDGRHMLGAYTKSDSAAIGFADYLEEHDDGMPWLGALLIARSCQRQGYGTELERRLMRHFHEDYGWSCVRAAVRKSNTAGVAFICSLGFRPVGEVKIAGLNGLCTSLVFERALIG
jgi:RimJ/RimL family protein N-acetyltransferase